MKKYLMFGVAALALASCNSHDFETYSQSQVDKAKYDYAFIQYIGGEVASNQDWGFSTTRSVAGTTRANQGETYAATHEYTDAEGNVIAGANMNANEWADPNKGFGGWVVPDALTDGQKERVRAYFQANPNIGFEDPELRHFFVQQVYKGGSAQAGASSENITAADGTSVSNSSVMNLLSVGQANSHINNFNGGSYGTDTGATGVSVLNNGQKVGGTSHTDQITLMVNVDDTSCFGYHETATNTQHNNKAALVSAADIDAWAATHGNPGEAVTDKWNRSFLGFDLALKEGDQCFMKDDDGNVIYANYSQLPEGCTWWSEADQKNYIVAWDGEKVIKVGEAHNWPTPNEYYEGYETLAKTNGTQAGWMNTNMNEYVAGESKTIAKSSQANLTDESVILKEFTIEGIKYQALINLPAIQGLLDEGYLPVNNKSLAEWVKPGKSDGYFTDWIVTLSPAERWAPTANLRIIAEDLSATSASDFDFNDVVLDVTYGTQTKIVLVAAGGTLPLRINGNNALEVHKLFGELDANADVEAITESLPMINTGAGPTKDPVDITSQVNVSIANAAEANTKLKLEVYKNGEWQEMSAPKGEPACKLAVDQTFTILGERQSIKNEYPLFVEWATANSFTSKWWAAGN